MPDPLLNRRGDPLCLVDRDGVAWRIHDTKFTGGRAHRLALGTSQANTRFFVAADGTQRWRIPSGGIAGGTPPWRSRWSTSAAPGTARGSGSIHRIGS